jgi:hypothetical protein
MGQVTVRKVVEGASHLVLRVDLLSDGTGELENYVILSPSDLNPTMPNNIPAFNILQIWYGLVWFDVIFKAGTVVPSMLWALSRDADSHIDFRSFGGVVDSAVYSDPPPDDNGKLTISTNEFTPVGSAGTIILELRKTNRASA